MGQPAGAVGARGGCRARCRQPDALDPAATDRVPRREITGKGKRERGNVTVYDVETPALLLHLDVVERNLAHMAARARQLGVALRPHAKTHKCVEGGRLQQEHGARGLTVSTLVEAEVFARAGFDDLTWAFPIDPSHISHARRIAEATGATLRVVVDDERTARALAGSGLHVWLKVDCGLHRAGVDPASSYALSVARERGAARRLWVHGIVSHSG